MRAFQSIFGGQLCSGFVCAAALMFTGCSSGFQGLLVPEQPACEITDEDLSLAYSVLALVNEERLRLGLNALEMDPELSVFASDFACTMIEDEFFGHVHPDTGETLRQRIADSSYVCFPVGENLASGQQSAEVVVDGWLDSPQHEENIINPQFELMGLGVARRDYDGLLYWVQMFLGERSEDCSADGSTPDAPSSDAPSSGSLFDQLKLFPDLPVSLPLDSDTAPVTESPPKPESGVPTSDE